MQIESLRVKSYRSWKVDEVSGPVARERLAPQLFGASLLQTFHLARKSASGEFFPLGLPRPRAGDGKFSDSTMPV